MPKQYEKKRWAAVIMGICLLCLSGCGLPDLFSDPETQETEFIFQAFAESSTDVDAEDTTEGTIFVYIVGEVLHPGVYEILQHDRLEAVVNAAGGFTEDAEPASVNLARTVTDGEQIVVLSRAAYAAAGAAIGSNGDASSGLVNINTANEKELATLPGIGTTRAQAIIAHRNK